MDPHPPAAVEGRTPERRPAPGAVRPRERGAWGILLVPYAMGMLATWPPRDLPGAAVGLLLVFALFIAQAALLPWLSGEQARARAREAAGWSLLVVAAAIVLACRVGLRPLGPVGAAAAALLSLHLLARSERGRRDVWAQWSGAAGLSLSGALAVVTQDPAELRLAWLVWGLAALYFTAGISLVRSCIAARAAQSPLRRARGVRGAVAWHAGAAFLYAAGAGAGLLPWSVPVTFLPALARLGWYLRKPRLDLSPRQLGWREVLLSMVFAAGALGFPLLP